MGTLRTRASIIGAMMAFIGSSIKIGGDKPTIKAVRQGYKPVSRGSAMMPHPRRFNGKRQWKVRKMANNGNGVGRSA